jgi:predicted CopG family antitoxin
MVLEEYTGKDSLEEVHQLIREKRLLENRVKHLEQT